MRLKTVLSQYLSQRDVDMARRFVERLKPGQLVKETDVQDM